MGVTGTSDLKRLIGRVTALRSPAWRAGLAKNLAQEAQSQILQGFQAQRDPYGRPWKPSGRAISQGGQTLSNTARLRRSFSSPSAVSRADDRGFVVGTNVLYAEVHQRGMKIEAKTSRGLRFNSGGRWYTKQSVTIPQRMMIPEGPLGPIWDVAFRQAAEAYFRRSV